MAQDRFFIYRKPTMEAQNVMLSFLAEAEPGSAPTTYRIAAMMDAMVATVWHTPRPSRDLLQEVLQGHEEEYTAMGGDGGVFLAECFR